MQIHGFLEFLVYSYIFLKVLDDMKYEENLIYIFMFHLQLLWYSSICCDPYTYEEISQVLPLFWFQDG